MFYYGKPKTRSAGLLGSALINSEKSFEYSLLILFRYSYSVILNLYVDLVLLFRCFNLDHGIIIGEFNGIIGQVIYYLFDTAFVGMYV